MEKIELKLHEVYVLVDELGFLLKEKLPITTKFWLSDILKKITPQKESSESLKEELIAKYGETEEEGGRIQLSQEIIDGDGNKIMNPNWILFVQDFNKLLQENYTLDYKSFKLDDFEKVESDRTFDILFKLVDQGE